MNGLKESGVGLILASASPRRVALLQQMGVSCQVFPCDIDESIQKDELAKNYVIRLAKQKAETCLELIDESLKSLPILAADTTVVYGGKFFNKPESPEDAKRIIKTLSGNVHHVHTAVALAFNGETNVMLSSTAVEFISLTPAQIDYYVSMGEHEGKAGAYGIQGLASTWIKRIDGSYSGVMGLPLYETATLLRKIAYLKY
jgi:septum formation protein